MSDPYLSTSPRRPLALREDCLSMKKTPKRPAKVSDKMRTEYDFSGGVRGKYASRYAEGTNVVVLEPDVAEEFPTAKKVNEALRKLLKMREPRRTA
jgi:hypothetical protein